MKVEINLLTVEDGQPKEIELFGEIYSIHRKDAGVIKISKLEIRKPEPRKGFKGKRLSTESSTPIFENILTNIQLCDSDNIDEQIQVIAKYYPDFKLLSQKRYLWSYRRKLGWTKRRAPKYYHTDVKKGKVITQIGNNFIYENILNDFKKAIEENRSVRLVFKKYSQKISSGTIKSYTSLYKRYLKEHENYIVKTSTKKRRIRGKKYKKKPPAGTYGYSKTYQTWIREKEVNAVKRGLSTVRFNYKPTSDVISKEIDMTKARVLATLSLLQEQDKVGYNISKKTPIYFIK